MKTLEDRKALAETLRHELKTLERVSPDSAYRLSFNLDALNSAIRAEEEDRVFLSADGAKGVLVLGISALGAEKASKFIAACGGWKSHKNGALVALDGERGEIRRNAKGTCWVIDLASPRGTILFGWESGPKEIHLAGPRLNTTNGAAWWCGVVSATMPFDPQKNPRTVNYIRGAVECLAAHGMTLLAWWKSENARKVAEAEAESLARPARVAAEREEAEKAAQAAEEARLMAELEAEQERIAAERAEQEAREKRDEEIATTCRAIGISPEQWRGMTEKQQRLALHRGRLAGAIPR